MPNFQEATHKVLRIAVECRTAEIAEYVSIETKNTVQAGPFKGMIIPVTHSWGTGDIAPKLLGTYECELHPAIEKAIARAPEVVFNVGAAEGYYAVGLALRLPQASIHAFDTSSGSTAVCVESFRLNNASFDGVGGGFTCQQLKDWGPNTNSLMVMDIEGDEMSVLSPYGISLLKYCDVIVECHDFMNPAISLELRARFQHTHDIEFVTEGPRDPHAIPMLEKLCSLDKALALSENRPSTMSWMIAWSKDRA